MADSTAVISVHGHESFTHCLPLSVHLSLNLLYQVVFVVGLTNLPHVFLWELHLKAFHVELELRINSLRVVTEVEALHVMNSTAEPFSKIRKVNVSLAIAVLDLQEFEQIVVLNCRICPKVLHEVLDRHLAIKVFIEG